VSTQPPPTDLSPTASVTTTLVWGYVALVFTLGLAWMVATPPGLFSDSVSGFLVMRSMERGAPFNQTFVVDPDDIAVDQPEFTAWWTPGQYVIPMVLGWSGLDLGRSTMVTTALAWLIGLVGFARLWRRLGFSSEVIAISVAVLFSQSYVLGWARFYHGGELLQWAFFPWFVLLALRCRELRGHHLVLLSAGLTLGAFFKSAFVIAGASVMASLLWTEVREKGGPFRVGAILLGARAAAVVGVALTALWAYTSLGKSPAGGAVWDISRIDFRESLFAAAGPLNSLFDLGKSYISITESTEWTQPGLGFPLLLVSIFSALLLGVIVRYAGSRREYLHLVVGVYVCMVAFFILAWALDILISFNVRHFRPAGVLLVPGIVALLFRIPARAGRWASLTALAALSLVMVFRFSFPSDPDPLARPVGDSGFSHIYASQAAVDALHEVDAQLGRGNDLIGVPWPQMALDVRRSRTFNMKTALESAEAYRYKVLFGQVDNLVVVLPVVYEERGFTPTVLRAFRQHSDWRRIRPEVEDFIFMYSGDHVGLR